MLLVLRRRGLHLSVRLRLFIEISYWVLSKFVVYITKNFQSFLIRQSSWNSLQISYPKFEFLSEYLDAYIQMECCISQKQLMEQPRRQGHYGSLRTVPGK